MVAAISAALTNITATLTALAGMEIVQLGAAIFLIFAILSVILGFFGARRRSRNGR